ncbi:RNA dependent RNA polymerase-domain-containing protein [Coniochaeta sp. 2T2.1]|nr:RNA dependent RNA polymerase-domain-containing protein [Coniochaeta sp. 2T2.1]
MTGRATGRPEPSTPVKNHGVARVEAFIEELNTDYNLGVELCDKTLTPAHRRERAKVDKQFARFDKISRILQHLYFRAEEGILTNVLEAFHREAKAACRKWIYKPRADHDTLPYSPAPCRATTPGEQNDLQEILVYILEQLKQTLQIRPLVLPKSKSITGATGDEPPDSFDIPTRPSQSTRSKSKRPSNEGLESSPKRVRELQVEPVPVTTVIDKVPARTKVGPDDLPSIFAKPSLFQNSSSKSAKRPVQRSFYELSANTSKASLVPSIFSNTEFEPLPASQSTVDPGPSQPKKVPPPLADFVPVSSTADFAPSSADIRALDESFSRYAERGVSPVFDESREADAQTQARQWSANQVAQRRPSVGYPELASSPGHSTEYSDFSGLLDIHIPDAFPPLELESDPLKGRLTSIWPKTPKWHREAPLAVLWEFIRVCLHCGIDIDEVYIQYDPAWADEKTYRHLWTGLRKHPAFSGKTSFPEPPDDNAWAAAAKTFSLQNMVVNLSMSIDFNPSKEGPLFLLRMNPLKIDKGCRINRRFGPDRFLEILIPSTNSKAAPGILKDGPAVDRLIQWLTLERHSLFGRQYAAFFVADAGYRKPMKEVRTSPDAKPIFKERVHLFAEHNNTYKGSLCPDALNVKRVEDMLDWLLHFKGNADQSYLKLFSRIQLGLSKTDPVIELEQHQIRHHAGDILSPTGKVMNDGIARVSLSIARMVQLQLGLSDMPTAIQGRMGSAKGMWIVDVHDPGTEDWIETYPSQRKWNCDQTDPFHRTLEVHGVSHELKSAGLNLQFLPVLEDRAKDGPKMRDTIGRLMAEDLHEELSSLKSSMTRPLQFRQWVHSRGSSARAERVQHLQVPFLGGLPRRTEETMNFLLDGGFNPKDQKYLQDLAFQMQKQKCDILKAKLNIRVGCSAYIYMVVDFWDILEEGEVHAAFSSKFQDPRGKFSDVLLHNMDVLVARSPAHLVSDVQKVKAVFKTELRALKDVIVFSAKGNTPLADKLSGGDYDGDKAWVCWDPDLVDNFVNADVPEPPDLSAFITKDKTTFADLVQRGGHRNILSAVGDMIEKSFKFNMGQSLLGQCTNYKEKLCYRTGTVRDQASLVLSTLLSNLVDQPKQGIIFGTDAWDRLRRHLKMPSHLDDPAYKFDLWTGRDEPSHVIDHLKFTVVKKTIDAELTAFYEELNPQGTITKTYDEDLVKPFEHFQSLARDSTSCRNLLSGLENSLGEVFALWTTVMGRGDKDKDESTFPQRVTEVYDKWRSVQPVFGGRQTRRTPDSKVVSLLLEPYLSAGDRETSHELSRWSLLKASMMFKLYHAKKMRFVWQICGRQLQFIKGMVGSAKGKGRVPTLVEGLMYAGLTVDKRFVTQYVAMMEGEGTEYMGEGDEEEDGEEDDGE